MTNKPFDVSHLPRLAELALDRAKHNQATQAEVSISNSRGFAVGVRMGEIENIEYFSDQGIGLTVYYGQKKGSASTCDFSDHAIQDCVDAACTIAKVTSEDDCAGLAEKDRLAFDYPDLDLHHPWDITPEAAIEMALACEQHGLAQDERLTNSEGASVSTSESSTLYANSHGFLAQLNSTRHGKNCMFIASQNGEMERDYDFTSARDASELLSDEHIAEIAARRTIERLGARKLDTMKVPVLFVPETATGILGHCLSGISGGALYRKASFLCDSLGKQIFPENITLTEQPHILKGLSSAPFDGDGVRTTEHDIIRDGRVASYILGTYSGRKLGMPSTGNADGIHTIWVATSDKTFKDMVRELHHGLIITELLGQGVNLITGNYSRGASGFWVENGEIQYPVHEITIASTLPEMFQNIVSIGGDIDYRRTIRTGSILIDSMMVAGN